MAQETNTTSPTARKPRAQLKHVLLDVDFFSKPKVVAFGYKFSQLAVLALIEVYAAMSRATDGVIDRDTFRGTVEKYSLDSKAILSYLIERDMIHDQDGWLTNGRVQKDQESAHLKRERWRKAKAKPEDSSLPSDMDSPVESARTLKSEDLKIEDLKLKEDVFDALKLWDAHLRKFKKSLDQIRVESLLAEYRGRESTLIEDIRYTASRGWQTLCAKPQNGTGPPRESMPERIERMKKEGKLNGKR